MKIVSTDIYEIARHHNDVDAFEARKIEAVLNADRTGFRQLWIERMTDLDGWCKRLGLLLHIYTSAEHLREVIRGREDEAVCRSDDPYELALFHGAGDVAAFDIATQLAATEWSGFKELWLGRLSDIYGFCQRAAEQLPDYLDPIELAHMIQGWERGLDPFDPDTLRVAAWIQAASQGGVFITTDIKTGEETGRFYLPGDRKGAAPTN